MTEPVQDTIEFTLMAEETVINDTVKLTAAISSIVTPDMTEAKLKDGIREMMKKLISETMSDDGTKKAVSWQFSNMSRTSHPSGMEQITLNATARVHESDNYSLDKRRLEVSQEGMSITHIAADTTPPTHMIEASESSLRIALLRKAQEELGKVTAASAGGYRLGRVVFENANDYLTPLMSNNRVGTTMKTAMAASYGSGFGGADDTLGNAVKLTMLASIVLRRSVQTDHVGQHCPA